MSDIEKGDVVRLKSGGPEMTVEDTGNYLRSAGIEDGVKCTWFDQGQLQTTVFDRASLEKVSS